MEKHIYAQQNVLDNLFVVRVKKILIFNQSIIWNILLTAINKVLSFLNNKTYYSFLPLIICILIILANTKTEIENNDRKHNRFIFGFFLMTF